MEQLLQSLELADDLSNVDFSFLDCMDESSYLEFSKLRNFYY